MDCDLSDWPSCGCRGYFTERDAAIVARTLLQIVEYCHARNILHRGALPCMPFSGVDLGYNGLNL